ncbi:hypothetical protein TNCV_4593241 [Trichonephila clavipes]|uniref:Uncharacterized protein n=1 Tax=Trichonephila clavipes TaxID=2585209 RepID=A0A8X6WFI0_TRICX|nr:hypothetical protein TNCV_4593241 [Trichonephila clavipes]
MSRFACLGRRGSFMENRLGYKTFADFVKFKSMFPAVLMVFSLVECALLVKLFYENKGNASAVVSEIRRRNNPLCEPMSTKGIWAINVSHRYLLMASLRLLTHSSRHQSLRTVARVQFLERLTVLKAPSEKCTENIMLYSPYMNLQTKELLNRDKPQRLSFEVSFLNRMTVDLSWPWNGDVERQSSFLPRWDSQHTELPHFG